MWCLSWMADSIFWSIKYYYSVVKWFTPAKSWPIVIWNVQMLFEKITMNNVVQCLLLRLANITTIHTIFCQRLLFIFHFRTWNHYGNGWQHLNSEHPCICFSYKGHLWIQAKPSQANLAWCKSSTWQPQLFAYVSVCLYLSLPASVCVWNKKGICKKIHLCILMQHTCSSFTPLSLNHTTIKSISWDYTKYKLIKYKRLSVASLSLLLKHPTCTAIRMT